MIKAIEQLLGSEAKNLLDHQCKTISKESLHLPGPELSLDSPESSKIPFGVAMAVAVVLYTASQAWQAVR